MQFPNGRYWWMPTNPEKNGWNIINAPIDENVKFWMYNKESGRPRQSPTSFKTIRKGDWILGYVLGDSKPHGVYALLQCTHDLTEGTFTRKSDAHICIKKVCDLDQYIPWEVFANDPVLKDARMVKLHNSGSLFGFTDKEEAVLLKLVRGFRGQRA